MQRNFIKDELVFFGVWGFFQKWGDKRSFSYLDVPRPDQGLIYVIADKAVFEYPDGSKKVFFKDSVIYLPRGAKYRVSFYGKERELHTLLVNFMTEGNKLLFSDITELLYSKNASVKDLFMNITELCKSRKHALFPVMSNFFLLLEALLPSVPEALPNDIGIIPALDYIDTHLGENPGITKLANLCLISESGFRKRFTAAIGQTPHEYILSSKLARACRMLGNPEVPIYDIAYELGFCDAAHFTKIFCEKTGKSPSAYRKDLLK